MCTDSLRPDGAVRAAVHVHATRTRSTPTGPCFSRAAPIRRSSISGLAFYEGASGSVVDYPTKYDGALFFVDYSRNCLGAILAGATACRTRARSSRSPAASQPRRPRRRARAATCTTSTTERRSRAADGYLIARSPAATATPDTGPGADHHPPRRVTLDEPDPDFQITDWDWDLDNDGGVDASTASRSTGTSTTAGRRTRSSSRCTAPAASRDTVVLTIDADNAPPGPDDHRPLDCDAPGCWTVGDTIIVHRHRDGRARTATSRLAARLERDHPPLPGGLPRAQHPRRSPGIDRSPSTRPTTSTRPTWSSAHRHRQRGDDRRRRRSSSQPETAT